MKIYIGWDYNEPECATVAKRSLAQYTDIRPEFLMEHGLRAKGLYTRTVDKRGQMYDLPSNAPCSTEFASSRFLVPILCQGGYALFTDCDVVFMANPEDMLRLVNPTKAVSVVKHDHRGTGTKMGGLAQTDYHRKNWSSVVLWNCDHPANQRLSLWDVNNRPGRDLHRFYWLSDDEIGDLPREWNWLVNVQPKPVMPKIAHFTNGGPWISGWESRPYDDVWLEAANA